MTPYQIFGVEGFVHNLNEEEERWMAGVSAKPSSFKGVGLELETISDTLQICSTTSRSTRASRATVVGQICGPKVSFGDLFPNAELADLLIILSSDRIPNHIRTTLSFTQMAGLKWETPLLSEAEKRFEPLCARAWRLLGSCATSKPFHLISLTLFLSLALPCEWQNEARAPS